MNGRGTAAAPAHRHSRPGAAPVPASGRPWTRRLRAAAALTALPVALGLLALGPTHGPRAAAVGPAAHPTGGYVTVMVDQTLTVRHFATVSRSAVRSRVHQLYPGAAVRVSAPAAGPPRVEVVTARSVLLRDGRSTPRPVTAAASTLDTLLHLQHVHLGRLDQWHLQRDLTDPDLPRWPTTGHTTGHTSGRAGELTGDRTHLQVPLRSGDAVTITRIRVTHHLQLARLPHATQVRRTDALPEGHRTLLHAGHDGRRVWRVSVRSVDGTPTRGRRTLVTSRAPRPRVVLLGTRVTAPPAPVEVAAAARPGEQTWPAVPVAEHANWAALAACESSGNPRVVSAAGYQGLYQFDVATWHAVGGHGQPIDASPAEQTYRAKLLYAQRGAQPWPVCGRHL